MESFDPSDFDLVTGATGFSGSRVVQELLDRGRSVIATDLPGAISSPQIRRKLDAVAFPFEHPRLRWEPADLLAPETLDPLFEHAPRRVFHTASLYDYSASLERLRRINVDGTRHLLDRIEKARPDRVVHWSTCGVFGKPYTAADDRPSNVPFTEDSPSPKNSPYDATQPAGTHLVNDYSVSKWEQEQMVWRFSREQEIPLTVVRPAPIYGPGSSYGHGGIILAIAAGWVPAIPADAKNYITTSVHVNDIARFAVFAADEPSCADEDYNVIDNSVVSYHEFLHYIALLTGQRLRDIPLLSLRKLMPAAEAAAKSWTWLNRKLGLPRVRVFEIQSAVYISSSYWFANRKSLATGFEYEYPDVREGLKDTVCWMREAGWLENPAISLV